MNIKTVRIDKLGKVVTGQTPPTNDRSYYGDYIPFVKPTDIPLDSRHTYITEDGYSKKGFEKYNRNLIKKGSTCVVTIGTVGDKITQMHCDCFTSQSSNTVIPNKNYDPDYIFYLLKYNLGQLNFYNSGTASGREHVSKSSFCSIEVSAIQEINIQKKIGQILSAYDDLIENNLKQIKLLEEAAIRLYREWFVFLRFPGHENVKVTDGVPEGWKKCETSSVMQFKYGKALKDETRTDFGHPVYGSSGIVGYHERALVPGPGIIVGRKGNVGSVYLSLDNFYPIDTTYYIETDFDIYYCYFELAHRSFNNNDSAVPGLNRGSAENMKMLIPDEKILKEFHHIIEQYIYFPYKLDKQNAELRKARDALLPRLMAGMIDVGE